MEREISYKESGESTDVDVLFEYCTQGIINNNDINSAKTSEWESGFYVFCAYLGHNQSLTDEDVREVITLIDEWLEEEKKTRETK